MAWNPIALRAFIAGELIAKSLGALPDYDQLASRPVEARRRMSPPRWAQRRMPPAIDVRDLEISGPNGPITLRTYDPTTRRDQRAPVIMYLHGGGWMIGGRATADHLCAHLAHRTGAIVISIDYRLAPDDPYPSALEDCSAALDWLATHADQLSADTSQIAVVGESAGGNLAAALCLLARDRSPSVITAQVLIYPALDATLTSPSLALTRSGLARIDVETVWRHYIQDANRRDPLVSPLLACDLSNLPPALILSADADVLRDDSTRYAQRLTDAGVPVRHINYPRTPHGFLAIPRICAAAPLAISEIAATISRWAPNAASSSTSVSRDAGTGSVR